MQEQQNEATSLEDAFQDTPPGEPEKVYPTSISEVDRLRVENLQLKMKNNQNLHQQIAHT